MRAKDIIPASKPRNFVAKNQKTGGAGAHKDKKKAEKQGDVKHKGKQFDEGVAEGISIIDQDSDLDQQVFTLNVDGNKVSFTYWDYETNFQHPDIKDIYQQAKEQLGKKLSPEQIKDVARTVFKSFEQGVAESELRDKADLQAKRKALQDLQMDPEAHKDPEIRQAIIQRKAALEKEAKAKGMAEGRHGYDDFGMSLAPGHDEGEPVYNPHYDRTGQYDRKAKYSQDYDYKSGKPLGTPSEKKGFIFYNVHDEQTARSLGLKQTKSGKWYLPTGSVFAQKQADKVFGKGKIWYPKG